MVSTAIAFIVFNRPAQTAQTFAAIKAERPRQLFIIADGPRPGHPSDAQRCAAVRALVSQVDWPCDVHREFADANLGCKQRVSSGLDWVFGQVERAIVLEDDCLPHRDFFSFCDAMLEHYAEDERVWVVTGNNFQDGQRHGNGSYYFSKFSHCWGWASWRRAWTHYDSEITFWPQWQASQHWQELTPDLIERQHWERLFDRAYRKKVDTWDYQWMASVWYHRGLTATPNVNLVRNIGFGEDATHTRSTRNKLADLTTKPLGELTHPRHVEQNVAADAYVFDHALGGRQQRWPRSLLMRPHRLAAAVARRIRQHQSRDIGRS